MNSIIYSAVTKSLHDRDNVYGCLQLLQNIEVFWKSVGVFVLDLYGVFRSFDE